MDLQIDFSAVLPEHLTPNFNKVVSILTQTLPDFPRGGAMLTKERKGLYSIKVYDKAKAENLLGKKIEYFFDDKSSKKVVLTIQEKPRIFRFKNPKYVTLLGFDRFPADKMENSQIDKILERFGKILVPTNDVYAAEIFLTGKKKCRIDLDRGEDIPRDLFVEFTTELGTKYSTTLRVYYKDQPYFCKRCSERHVGNCPEWEKQKTEKESVKEVKKETSVTSFIGDSNFRCLNEGGLMASVTTISGGKIGHVCNQLKFEDLSKTKNVILSGGHNCINDTEELGKNVWEKRVANEVKEYEGVTKHLVSQGKNVFIVGVPPTPFSQASAARREARKTINQKLSGMVQRVISGIKKGTGMAAFIEENDGNYNEVVDFTDEKHLSPLAMEKLISKLDEILPPTQKLKDQRLKGKPTCRPYQGCYGTYPIGCNLCTQINHNEQMCPLTAAKEKRMRSTGSEEEGAEQKKPKK